MVTVINDLWSHMTLNDENRVVLPEPYGSRKSHKVLAPELGDGDRGLSAICGQGGDRRARSGRLCSVRSARPLSSLPVQHHQTDSNWKSSPCRLGPAPHPASLQGPAEVRGSPELSLHLLHWCALAAGGRTLGPRVSVPGLPAVEDDPSFAPAQCHPLGFRVSDHGFQSAFSFAI